MKATIHSFLETIADIKPYRPRANVIRSSVSAILFLIDGRHAQRIKISPFHSRKKRRKVRIDIERSLSDKSKEALGILFKILGVRGTYRFSKDKNTPHTTVRIPLGPKP